MKYVLVKFKPVALRHNNHNCRSFVSEVVPKFIVAVGLMEDGP